MNFLIAGCHCCGGYCTHRVFNSDGELLWSATHPGITKSDPTPGNDTAWIWGVDISGDHAITMKVGYTPTAADRSVVHWDSATGSNNNEAGVDQVGSGDWDQGSWVSDSTGAFYTNLNERYVRKYDDESAEVWTWDREDDIADVGSTSFRLNAVPVISFDETFVCIGFERRSGSSNYSTGWAILDSDGTFVSVFEDQWKTHPVDSGRRAAEVFLDSDNRVIMVFGVVVSLESDYGTNTGCVWIYELDGTFVTSYTPTGNLPSNLAWQTAILSNTTIFTINAATDYAYAIDLSDGSTLASIDLSAYATTGIGQLTHCQCDQLGNVYVVGSYVNLICLDSDLNIIWTFEENESVITGFNRSIQLISGMRCTDGKVLIGGGLKSLDFDPSQLVIL